MFFEPVSGTFLCVGFWILIVVWYIKEKVAERKREEMLKKLTQSFMNQKKIHEYWRNQGG